MSCLIRIEARLVTPLAEEPPQIDALLELVLARYRDHDCRLDRTMPAPEIASVPIPLCLGRASGQPVYRSTSPIYRSVGPDTVDYYCRRLDPGWAFMWPEERIKQIPVTGGKHKSYRLPLRVRVVPQVVWYAIGDRKEVHRLLKRVQYLGKKTSQGYGRVTGWQVENIDEPDVTWYAKTDQGSVLMRPLPAGGYLPSDLIGYRPSFGACNGPYWHPDRMQEIVVPC